MFIFLVLFLVILATPASALSTWEERSTAPGVLRATRFDDADWTTFFTNQTNGFFDATGYAQASQDRTVKASGDGSLRFTVPLTGGPNNAGSFNINFTAGSVSAQNNFTAPYPTQIDAEFPSNELGPSSAGKGVGHELWVQFRWRTSSRYLQPYVGASGFKVSIVGEGDRNPGDPGGQHVFVGSCSILEVVIHDNSFTGYPRMYHSCGGKDGQYEPLTVIGGAHGNWYQSENPNCFFPSAQRWTCQSWLENTWITFMYHIKVGHWYRNNIIEGLSGSSAAGLPVGSHISAAGNKTFSLAAQTITRATGSWLTDGYTAGMKIAFYISAGHPDNSIYTIQSVTATTITVDPVTPVAQDYTGTAGAYPVATFSGGTMTVTPPQADADVMADGNTKILYETNAQAPGNGATAFLTSKATTSNFQVRTSAGGLPPDGVYRISYLSQYWKDSLVELYAGYDGQPLRRIHSVPNYDLANDNILASMYGKITLLPYQNTRDPAVDAGSLAYVWYDELIVSTQPIASPVASATNPTIAALPANTWAQLPSSSLRFKCQSWMCKRDPEIITPQGRVQNGVQYDPTRNQLVYWGGAHSTHPGNDIERFRFSDPDAGGAATWTQETVPEAVRMFTGTYASSGTGSLSPTLTVPDNNGPGGVGRAYLTSTLGITFQADIDTDFTGALIGIYAPPNGAATFQQIASYDRTNHVVTLSAPWLILPAAGSAFIIMHDGGHLYENGFSSDYVSASGAPYVEHVQDDAKVMPNSGDFLLVHFNGTWTYNFITKTWTRRSGTHTLNDGTISSTGLVSAADSTGTLGNGALLEYDAGLAASTDANTPAGNLGFQWFWGGSTGQQRWILKSDFSWQRRPPTGTGFPPGWPTNSTSVLSALIAADAIHSSRNPNNRSLHLLRLYGSESTVMHFYLYDAVADTFVAVPELDVLPWASAAGPYHMAYDSVNKKVLLLSHNDGSTAWFLYSVDLSTNPATIEDRSADGPHPLAGISGILGGYLLRYSPVDQAFVFLKTVPGGTGTGFPTETWVYKLTASVIPPGVPNETNRLILVH